MSKKNCKFDYLKPISYDDLFDDRSKNKCTDYQLVLDKLTEARSAFFGFQAGIYNFIKDCTKLQQKIRNDVSGNDLNSLKYEYMVLLNNLISNVAISLRKKMESDHFILINFEVPPTQTGKTIDDMQVLPATNIIFSNNNGTIDTLIANIPSVLLYLKDNYQLQVKFVYPKSVSYNNLSFEKTYIKSFRPKCSESFVRNMTPELALINCRECLYGFNSSDFAFDILEDIINYDTDQSIRTHQLEDVIERLDGIILSIENTHRTIIQKIKTEQLVENNLFNESKIVCKTKKSKKSKKCNECQSESESGSDSDDC
jgi:hypothetical protein